MSQEFDNDVLDLVKQKGFYPYEYMTNFEKFEEELPVKEIFYSSITDRKMSDREYEHVLNVWKKSEFKTMKGYHDLYLNCDILLLAVFEKFRNNSLKSYGLGPSHYLSAACLSQDAMLLKMTKTESELFPDPDMHIFFEKSTLGGISSISITYSKNPQQIFKILSSKVILLRRK